MARLSIRLLGPLQVTLDGEPVTAFESDKVRALLAYLSVEHQGPQRREKLAGLLWPDWPETSARMNLRRALADLRKALGDHQATPPFLHISHHTIQFNRDSDAWVDVVAFGELLRSSPPPSADLPITGPQTIHHLEEAVALYCSAFLESFSLAGCPDFEEWMLFQGERLHRLALETLDRLSDWYEKQRQFEQALKYVWRQVELDPWRESGHQQAMRMLAQSGQRGAALAQYETCRRVLAEELGVEPGAETTRLYEQIRDGELGVSVLVSAPIQGPEQGARLPGFLTGETEEVQPPVFVARERELARLESFLEVALAGQGDVVFVTGGPGRGKTALLEEFARRAMVAEPDLLVASGNCNAYSGIGDPYLAFRDVLGMLTGDVEAKWAAGAITRDHALRLWDALPLVGQALADCGPHVIPALVSGPALLARALVVAPAGAPWLQRLREHVERLPADSESLEQIHLFQQVTNLLRALAEAHPLLLILDDLQWADSASIGLLFHLGRRLKGNRILVAGAYRPEEIALGRDGARSADLRRHPLEEVLAELKRRSGDVWVDLAEVQEQESRHFVNTLLETEPNRLGEDFRSTLCERTGGHPLFTIELLRTMQERGDLVQDEAGHWVQGSALDWKTLPARVEGVIQARLGRLDEEQRELLSVASVEGEEFTAQVVARVQKVGDRQAMRTLSQELEKRHRLVRERSATLVGRRQMSRYRFAHALFQQYLYNHLSAGERALLHGEIAGVLEELYGGRMEELAAIAPQLAYHYTKAGDERLSLKYLTLAGDGALATYANQEATDYYRRAMELTPAEPERAHLLSGLGEALHRQSRFREAIGIWGQGIELYQSLADSDGLARLYANSARAAQDANDPAEALQICLEGLVEVEGAPESSGLARLLQETARAYALNAQREEARPLAQRALEMAERLGDIEVQAYALASPGTLGLLSMEHRLEALTRAIELAESQGQLHAASRAHRNLANLAQRRQGDYQTAQKHLRRAAELDEQAGNSAGQILSLNEQAWNLMLCGELKEAGKMLSQVQTLLKDLTEPTYTEQAFLVTEGLYLLFLGEWEEGARRQRALLASARERGDDCELAHAGDLLAFAVLDSSRFLGSTNAAMWEEVETILAEGTAIWDRSLHVHASISNRVWLGLLHLAQGRPGEARHLLEEAQQKAMEELAIPEDDGLLHWLQALIASAEGYWEEALAAHEAADRVFDRFGMRWHRARVLLDWAETYATRGEQGDWERARELLLEAQTAYEEMGGKRYAAVARDRLQELGAREEPSN